MDARIAIIELRSLLVADSFIGLDRRKHLIRRATSLVDEPVERVLIAARMSAMIASRFGRNPDNLEPSRPTLAALRLLDLLQNQRRKT
ncbi:hypothetical protein PZ895_10575 [Mesorhizobium sp. YIM 152430]|uniref:hypothetical protein n=1 Tax=Mesorhizobium sp. YIM 152430 TaxID=3031761 RepID=UPI0023DC1AA2|nr:hypothetical protein [Mesorhizobium sp. YIM 152430]MDF1600216.1 hypothetical protein [Mesorhizobium sp. YIM 152430]